MTGSKWDADAANSAVIAVMNAVEYMMKMIAIKKIDNLDFVKINGLYQ